ncbi:Protein Y26E6A.3 [Aphelenchoides avenae]|nr:Protein Y26E6A.3 [Aphelenchus avenae]
MLGSATADRNKGPILEVFRQYYERTTEAKFLEIQSGTGIHVMHLAKRFPRATWQPSEDDPRLIHSVVAYVDRYRPLNVRVPLYIDVRKPPGRWALPADYGPGQVDAIFTINTLHRFTHEALNGLFHAAEGLVKPGSGLLIVYGPFSIDGKVDTQKLVELDETLRKQNPEWGLRDVQQLKLKALQNGLRLTKMHNMTDGNYTLIFEKS